MTFSSDTCCKSRICPAINYGERNADLDIDILLLHYTGMESAEKALQWLCCEESGVSCHYFVHEDGRIAQLVPEEKRAWHAGKSLWQGEADTNSRSIGIEIANGGHDWGYPDFPDVQIEAVIELCQDIISRNPLILPRNVLAHSDVAPGRKQDPGEKFPWQKLHQRGVGLWVTPDQCADVDTLSFGDFGREVAMAQLKLSKYGYGIDINGQFDEKTEKCVIAFQQHFRQSKVDGCLDGETLGILDKLIFTLENSSV